MSKIVDDAGQVREVKRVVDNDLSGNGDNSPRIQALATAPREASPNLTVVVVCAILCTVTALGTLYAIHEAHNAETESRLVEYYLQDPNSRTPDELASWAKFVHQHGKDKE